MTGRRIVYVNHTYPQLTQTFTAREIRALREGGHSVETLSFKRPSAEGMDEEFREEIERTEYFPPFSSVRFLAALPYNLLRRPLRTLRSLLLFTTRETNTNARRTAAGFLREWMRGLVLASRLDKMGKEVHLHFPHSTEAATSGLVAFLLTRAKYSFTNHTSYNVEFMKQKVEHARFVASISEYDKRMILGFTGGRWPEKIQIVHCGLDPDKWTIPPPGRADPPLILSVGSLIEKKGHRFLIQACRRLADGKADFRCVIVGRGPLEQDLRGLVNELDLSDRVELAGALPQSKVRELLDGCTAFCLPSIHAANGDLDGIPVVLMEAMAKQKPVVTTDISGIPELVTDRTCGLLVPEKDPEALAAALGRLLSDAALSEALGREARSKVAADFNLRREADRLAELFEQSLKDAP